eukprot:3811283-Rhodomonas_salina.5
MMRPEPSPASSSTMSAAHHPQTLLQHTLAIRTALELRTRGHRSRAQDTRTPLLSSGHEDTALEHRTRERSWSTAAERPTAAGREKANGG